LQVAGYEAQIAALQDSLGRASLHDASSIVADTSSVHELSMALSGERHT